MAGNPPFNLIRSELFIKTPYFCKFYAAFAGAHVIYHILNNSKTKNVNDFYR
jgi:hypothetical protein